MKDAFEHFILIGWIKWRQTSHHLVEHSAETVVINPEAVRFAIQHFWAHVFGRTAVGLVQQVVFLDFGEAEVGEFDVTVDVDKDIFWLEIAVEDVLIVDVFKAEQNFGEVELGFVLAKNPLVLQQVE